MTRVSAHTGASVMWRSRYSFAVVIMFKLRLKGRNLGGPLNLKTQDSEGLPIRQVGKSSDFSRKFRKPHFTKYRVPSPTQLLTGRVNHCAERQTLGVCLLGCSRVLAPHVFCHTIYTCNHIQTAVPRDMHAASSNGRKQTQPNLALAAARNGLWLRSHQPGSGQHKQASHSRSFQSSGKGESSLAL